MENIQINRNSYNSTKKENFEVPFIPKKITGYQAQTYYNVSWLIGIPEMLDKLQMPFDKEYNLALSMVG